MDKKQNLPIYPGCITPTDYHAVSPIIAACGGSYMVSAELIDNQKWEDITDLCRRSREIIKTARLKGAAEVQ